VFVVMDADVDAVFTEIVSKKHSQKAT